MLDFNNIRDYWTGINSEYPEPLTEMEAPKPYCKENEEL